MKISQNGKDLLKQWEGISKTVYLDSAGLPTIGCGHLLTRDELTSGKIIINNVHVKYRNGLSDLEIDQLLDQDLDSAEYAVNTSINTQLTQDQFDALCSFAFNVGTRAFMNSTLRKVLNGGMYEDVSRQFRRWTKVGGRVVSGLVNRRENEIKLFSSSAAKYYYVTSS